MGTLRVRLAVVVAVIGVLAIGAVAVAHDRGAFRARLSGFEEVPAVITDGNGRFEARLNQDAGRIEWSLHYADTNAAVTQAHIHVGQRLVSGGITVWLCANPPVMNIPPGTQACPPAPADISGTITAAQVVGPAAQGILADAPDRFDRLVRALRSGLTYANVHTTQSPAGEIRGQISSDRRDH